MIEKDLHQQHNKVLVTHSGCGLVFHLQKIEQSWEEFIQHLIPVAVGYDDRHLVPVVLLQLLHIVQGQSCPTQILSETA